MLVFFLIDGNEIKKKKKKEMGKKRKTRTSVGFIILITGSMKIKSPLSTCRYDDCINKASKYFYFKKIIDDVRMCEISKSSENFLLLFGPPS